MHLDSNIVREDIFDVAFLTEADVALLKDGFDVEDKEEKPNRTVFLLV